MNGDAQDASGNGNDGTVYGAVLVNDKDGNLNSAYYFDGNDHIDVGSSNFGITDAFTIAFWINAESATDSTIIRRGQYIYPFTIDIRYQGEMRGGTRNSAGSVGYTPRSYNPIGIGNWYHVAFTYNNGQRTVYIDGIPDTSDTYAGGLSGTGGNTNIGSTPSSTAYFTGYLDDVRIYTSALSQGEIQNIMSGQQTYHSADLDHSCDISTTELFAFMNRWRVSIADVPMPEMMEAIELWKSGNACV